MSTLKKLGVLVLSIGLVIGLFGFAQLAEAKKEKPIVLRMAAPWPDRGFTAELVKWWGSTLEKRTNGKIRFEYYWGGMLGTIKEILYSLERGTCDFANLANYVFEKDLPVFDLCTTLIGTFEKDPVITTKAFWQLTNEFPIMNREWETCNAKLMASWELGSYLFFSKKPIRTYNDLKGLKCGAWGARGSKDFLRELGAIPVSIPSVEAYDALDKGTMDARPCTTDMIVKYKYYEIGKYATEIGTGTLGSPVYVIAINLDKWKSLSTELQEAFENVNKDFKGYFEERVREAWAKDVKFLESEGMTFLEFSEADKAKVRSLSVFETYKQKYIARVKEAGYSAELGEKIYNRYRELVKHGK